ncbi:hypothetical protein [Streptacidiphilus fuscans]|uniref:WXG100 family type VII secretion target n=1 Tax=Streptacidiphilus fuscans TaxID=2789292 RepID=A0A931BE52_9ACTN|nr:hypothetical protein [Streptacidiphilus fuscans]MBF9072533.1 hypothetical protein [Streptacidiphilus fuscans]
MGTMGSGDYNSGGFTQGGDGTVFGDPSSDPGSVQDYDNWDWKQIEAAINGMSAGVDSSANSSHAKSVSDPQSLQDAADIFFQVQQVLSGVAQAFTDQAKALAGDNGPWKGDAADSFLTMMETFSKQVTSTAAALSGGTSGVDSVPQQLANNAVNLVNAQNLISEIDTYYANEAIKSGVTPMSNGLIPISQRPQLVEWMNEDMRAVLKSLAGEYQVTIDSVRSPGPINSPLGNTPPPTTGNGPDQPAFTDTMPAPVNPDLSGLRTADTAAPLTPMDLSANPLGPGANPLGPGANLKSLDPSGLNPSGLGSGLGSGLDPSGLGTGLGTGPGISALNPSALDRALNPSAYSGGLGTGGTGGLGNGLDPLGLSAASLLPRAGNLGTGGAGSLPAEKSAFKSSAFPGETGVGGVGSLGAAKPGKLSTGDGIGTGGLGADERFPGSTSLESGLPGSGTGTAEPGVGAAGGLGEGMPYMPGMGGGAGQAAGHNGERSDASGLLDASGKPWAGATNVGGDIGGHLGTAAGGEGLSLPTEHAPGLGADTLPGATALSGQGAGTGTDATPGEGMPYMPGMGGGAGQAASGHNGERSDASGLLASSAEPWAGETGLGSEVGGHLGTAAGGEGLGLPTERAVTTGEPGAAAEEVASGETAAEGEGMPFLPGMGGAAGAAAGERNGERSDASGLLDPSADPWSGDPAATEPEVQATAAGGEGLALAVGAAAAAVAVASAVAAETSAEPPATAGQTPTPQLQPQERGAAVSASGEATAAAGATEWSAATAAAELVAVVGEAVASSVTAGPGSRQAPATQAAQAAQAAQAGEQTTTHGANPASPAVGEAAVLPAIHAVDQPIAGAPQTAGQAPTPATPPGLHPAGTSATPPTSPAGGRPAAEPGSHHPAAGVPSREEAWAADAGEGEEADFAEVELAEPAASPGPVPTVLRGGNATGWDTAGAAFVPLLGSVPVQEDRDVRATGYSAEAEGAWGTSSPAASSAQPAEEEPRFATWRPNRSIVTTSTEASPVVYRSSAEPACAVGDFEEEPAPEADAEEPAEEKSGRGAADLLVQASDTWGVAADDDFDAII